MISILNSKKRVSPFFIFYVFCFSSYSLLLGERANVVAIERAAQRATMNVVLVCSSALAVVHTGRTVADMRRTLALREFETAVSAFIESTVHWNIHLVRREHLQHVLLLVFRLRARIVGAALAAAVRNFASLASTCLLYKVRAFKDDKARGAVEADLAD